MKLPLFFFLIPCHLNFTLSLFLNFFLSFLPSPLLMSTFISLLSLLHSRSQLSLCLSFLYVCLSFLVFLLVVSGAALPFAGIVHAGRADGAGDEVGGPRGHEVSHCRRDVHPLVCHQVICRAKTNTYYSA